MLLRQKSICLLYVVAGVLWANGSSAQEYRVSRIELGPQLQQIYLPVDPVGTVDYHPGVGGILTVKISSIFNFDAAASITPGIPIDSTGSAGGRMTQVFTGFSGGISKRRVRILGKFRPGLVSFGSAITRVGPPPQFQFFRGRLTEPALDIGGIAEVGISKRFAARYEAGDTIIRYGSRTFIVGQPPSRTQFANCFQFGIGFMFRFH